MEMNDFCDPCHCNIKANKLTFLTLKQSVQEKYSLKKCYLLIEKLRQLIELLRRHNFSLVKINLFEFY